MRWSKKTNVIEDDNRLKAFDSLCYRLTHINRTLLPPKNGASSHRFYQSTSLRLIYKYDEHKNSLDSNPTILKICEKLDVIKYERVFDMIDSMCRPVVFKNRQVLLILYKGMKSSDIFIVMIAFYIHLRHLVFDIVTDSESAKIAIENRKKETGKPVSLVYIEETFSHFDGLKDVLSSFDVSDMEDNTCFYYLHLFSTRDDYSKLKAAIHQSIFISPNPFQILTYTLTHLNKDVTVKLHSTPYDVATLSTLQKEMQHLTGRENIEWRDMFFEDREEMAEALNLSSIVGDGTFLFNGLSIDDETLNVMKSLFDVNNPFQNLFELLFFMDSYIVPNLHNLKTEPHVRSVIMKKWQAFISSRNLKKMLSSSNSRHHVITM